MVYIVEATGKTPVARFTAFHTRSAAEAFVHRVSGTPADKQCSPVCYYAIHEVWMA